MVKWASVRSKQLLEIKGIKCIYSMVLMIKVTHTMMPELITSWSKNLLRHRTKPMVVDVAADKPKMMEERKGGPSKAMLKSILLLILHV